MRIKHPPENTRLIIVHPRPPIRFKFAIVTVFTSLSILGYVMIPGLAVGPYIGHSSSKIVISYHYPGASPEVLDQLVASKIESSAMMTEGVESISSTISSGGGFTELTLNKKDQYDRVRHRIVQELRRQAISWPASMSFPRITHDHQNSSNPDDVFMSYSISGPTTSLQKYNICKEQLIPLLAGIEGLAGIELHGAGQLEHRMLYQANFPDQLSFGFSQIKEFVLERIKYHSLGRVCTGSHSRRVRINSEQLKDILSHSIRINENQISKMGDLVQLTSHEEKLHQVFRINGQDAVRLKFIRGKGANLLELSNKINKQVEVFSKSLPQEHYFNIDFDRSKLLRQEFIKLRSRTIWSVLAILSFACILYRSKRVILVILVSSAVTMGLSLMWFHLFSIPLNLYSLAGITISFGLVLDYFVILSHHHLNLDNLSALPALFTSTLTTITALAFVLVLPDQLKGELSELVLPIVINLVLSLITAALFLPALLNEIQTTNRCQKSTQLRWISRLFIKYKRKVRQYLRFRHVVIFAAILCFGIPTYKLPNYIEGVAFYNKSIGSELYQNSIKSWLDPLLGGSIRLFDKYVYRGRNFQSHRQTVLHIYISMPPGMTYAYLDPLIRQLENQLDHIGVSVPLFLTNIIDRKFVHLAIHFAADHNTEIPYLVKSRIESMAINYGGLDWTLYGVGKGFDNSTIPSSPRFRILLKGYRKPSLDKYGQRLARILKQNPKIENVVANASINWWERDRKVFKLTIDPEWLARNQVSGRSIAEALIPYNQEPLIIGRTQSNKRISISHREISDYDFWNLKNTQHTIDSIRFVMGPYSYLREENTPPTIHKRDREYLQLVEFDYLGHSQRGQAVLEKSITAISAIMPLGYSAEVYQPNLWASTTQMQYWILIVICIAIFMICAVHFESLSIAFAIISILPLSFIGIFLTFYFFRFPFNQGGLASFLLVGGVSVNSLLLIYGDYKKLLSRSPHRNPPDIFNKAIYYNLKPIFIAIVSTSVGMIPFIVDERGGAFWPSLAAGSIGGLVFSFLFLLFILPFIALPYKIPP